MSADGVGVILETPTQALIAERDRARETAMRLEEELASVRGSIRHFAEQVSTIPTDSLARHFFQWAARDGLLP